MAGGGSWPLKNAWREYFLDPCVWEVNLGCLNKLCEEEKTGGGSKQNITCHIWSAENFERDFVRQIDLKITSKKNITWRLWNAESSEPDFERQIANVLNWLRNWKRDIFWRRPNVQKMYRLLSALLQGFEKPQCMSILYVNVQDILMHLYNLK